jgi:hypothetical protein
LFDAVLAKNNLGSAMIRCLLFLLVLFSFDASAQVINLSAPGDITYNLGPASGSANFFSVTHTGSGTFTDVYDFSLVSPGTDIGNLGLYEGVSPISIGIYNSSGLEVIAGEGKLDNGEQYWIFPGQLSGGSYYFKIVGNVDGVRNPFIPPSVTYLFTDAVSPVPEPSTYALMLVGLAALGWMVIRRSRTPRLAL